MAEQVALSMTKQCSICSQTKPLAEFSKQASCPGGFRNECQNCKNAKARDWYLRNKERKKKAAQEWRDANRDKVAKASSAWTKANADKKLNHLHARKARLKQNGVYQVSATELKRLYSSPCFYCGTSDKITQDHVIPIHRGGRHSIGNLVAACQSCNSSKQDKTITEWKLHLQKTTSKGGI